VPGEIVVDHAEASFYDFESKYLSATHARTDAPADLPADVAELGMRGWTPDVATAAPAIGGQKPNPASYPTTPEGKAAFLADLAAWRSGAK